MGYASDSERKTSIINRYTQMKTRALHALRHSLPRSSAWCRKSVSWMLSGVLALGIVLCGAPVIQAEQILELPPTTSADSPLEAPLPSRSVRPRSADVSAPAGVGSVGDYENQDDSAAPGAANVTTRPRFERNSNQPALASEIVMGALVLGVLAMELHSAHHR